MIGASKRTYELALQFLSRLGQWVFFKRSHHVRQKGYEVQNQLAILGLAALVVCGALLLRKSLRAEELPLESDLAVSPDEDAAPADGVLARVRADVKEFGWHLILVSGEGRPGFLYSIGLWETYRHPEVILFGSEEDPAGFSRAVRRFAKTVAGGEEFKHGDRIPEGFGKHEGFVKNVRPKWYPSFLGTAGAYYQGFDFPAIQLFWPDAQGLFPWQSGYPTDLFGLQPALYQDNAVLAGVGYDEIRRLIPEGEAEGLDKAAEDLFITLESSVADDLLQSWRWRVGPDARPLRTTIFGDVFLQNPDGSIDWLDTGANELSELAQDRESWHRVAYDNPAIVFRASLLLHLRELKVLIEPGQVYDWIREPMVGGTESVDNIQWGSLRVHLDSTGQLARSLSSNETNETVDDKTIYSVVVNDEEQYSILPSDRELPDGWTGTGKTGTKQECLEIIESLWVDLRPKSLREKVDQEP